MEKIEYRLANLEEEIRKMIQILINLKEENERLVNKNRELEILLEKHKKELKEKEEKNKFFKIAKILNERKKDENYDIRAIIDDLVREIDDCITLLKN